MDHVKATQGIEVSLSELIALRSQVIHHSMANQPKPLKYIGQKPVRLRGRGIDFESTREYQAGDDIRNMAWRVTARSLKPHIKIYHEEKERPVWLALDLSPGLFFGTRTMFKSARLIKQAGLLGWSHLLKREKIGAIIAKASKTIICKPQSSEQNYTNILNLLSHHSSRYFEITEDNYLCDLLLSMQQQVRTGNLVYILSDFMQFNHDIQKIIIHLSQRAQINLISVYDPFEAEPPPPNQYMLTNGLQKILFNMTNTQNRLDYQKQFQEKQNDLIQFSRKHNIPLQILCTEQKQI